MSNPIFEAHDTLGSPCGENAGLDEIADWAGSVLLKSLSGSWFPWRPIDSAPQDGTAILVATPQGMYVVYWLITSSVEYDEGGSWFVETSGGDCSPLYETPTHWLALPPAPETV